MKANNVKLIVGSHGSGKSDWLYNRFLCISRDEKNEKLVDLDKKIYLVVPEQDTNEKQRILMNRAKDKNYGSGIFNIDVVSFDRLAHNVFDILNIEPNKEKIIEDDSKTMILSLILSKLNREGKIKYYKRMANRIGFAKKLTQVASEFYSYNVTDEDIDKVINNQKSDKLNDKLLDLKLIFNEFKKNLTEKNLFIKEDKYNLLDERILDVDMFNDCYIAFDGFTGFTPVQLRIFEKIARVAKEVYVTIDIRNPKEITLNKPEEVDLFYLSKKFIYDINKILELDDKKLSLDSLVVLDGNYKYKKDDKKDLDLLEKHLFDYSFKGSFDIKPKNITLYAANNVEEEIENAIQIITECIRYGDYKYSDIKIVVSSVEDYKNQIINSFTKNQIPFFIDDSSSVLNSPYIEAIRAAIDVVNYDFTYDSVMRYIDAGIIAKDDEIYLIDNFIKAHAIRGVNRYKNGLEKISDRNFNLKEVVDTINKHIGPLVNLSENFKKANTLKDYLDVIIDFMNEIELDEKFDEFLGEVKEKITNEVEYKNQYNVLKYSKEIIEKTIKNINEIIYINDEKVEIEDFKRLFDVGITEKGVKTIPYSLDQIVIGDVMRSRFDNPKLQIFLGLNQSKIPAKTQDLSLIDDRMRKAFYESGKELSQTTFETALNQRFYAYLICTNPIDSLVLSYTRLDSNNESDEKSSLVASIENLFLTYETIGSDKKIVTSLETKNVDSEDFKFYNTYSLLNFISENMQNLRKSYIKDKDGSLKYALDENDRVNVLKTKKAISYFTKNDKNFTWFQENILKQPKRFAELLLNSNINNGLLNNENGKFKGSATTIEKYNSCPYKFFLERLLYLKDIGEFGVDSLNIGNYAHKALENVFNQKNVINLSDDELNKKIEDAINVAEASDDVFSEFDKKDKNFHGSNKLSYIKESARRLIKASVKSLIDINKSTNFDKFINEHSFKYNIDGNIIEGKIDKIEEYETDENVYLNILDYKSGKKAKELVLKDVDNGVNIQLLLYLDYSLNSKEITGGKNPIFCGSLYFWVNDNIMSLEMGDDEKELETINNKKVELNGLYTNDKNDISNVLKNPILSTTKNNGDIVKKIKISDEHPLNANLISKTELDAKINNMHQKITETIDNINKGIITARPYKPNNCEYCEFSDICMKELVKEEGQTND